MGKKIDKKIVKLLLKKGGGIIEYIEELMNQLREVSMMSEARSDASHRAEQKRLLEKHEQALRLGEVEIAMAELRFKQDEIRFKNERQEKNG